MKSTKICRSKKTKLLFRIAVAKQNHQDAFMEIILQSNDKSNVKNVRNQIGIHLLSENDEIPKTFNPRSSKWIKFPTFSQNLVTLQKSQNTYYKGLFQSYSKPDIISFNPIQQQPADLVDPNDYLSTLKTKISINFQFRSLDIIKRIEYSETDILSYLSSLGGFFGMLKISLLLASLFEYLYEAIRENYVGKSMKQLNEQIDNVVNDIDGNYIPTEVLLEDRKEGIAIESPNDVDVANDEITSSKCIEVVDDEIEKKEIVKVQDK